MNNFTRKLVIFLVRKKLGLKRGECFQFVGQKSSTDFYYFTKNGIDKVIPTIDSIISSHVSLNYLLSDSCKITKTGETVK